MSREDMMLSEVSQSQKGQVLCGSTHKRLL